MYYKDTTKPFWAMGKNEAMDALKTTQGGLLEKEAAARLATFGANDINDTGTDYFTIFLSQFKSPLILILVAAFFITFFLRDWIDMWVILAAILVNVSLGFYQENKAETALKHLGSYIHTRSRVRRGNQEREIDAYELVPGDIIRVSQGDRVPADARLLFVNDLEVDESILTGEALPVEKTEGILPAGTAIGDRLCMIFSGTLALRGLADAVITHTGNTTEFGKIAAMVGKGKRDVTPLQRSISRFTIYVSGILGGLIVLLLAVGVLFGRSLFEMFLIGVAVAVSVVPEGLPIALTAILALGVQRLAQKRGVIRKLLAAETLGSTTLILTDKTGTLTQAKMEMAKVIPYGKEQVAESEKELIFYALLNTDVVIENSLGLPDEWKISGKPLEVALVRGAARRGVFFNQIWEKRMLIDRLPFSSEHKFSASVSQEDGRSHLALLGAPDILLKYSSLSEKERALVLGEIETRARAGERVLGVVSKKVGHDYLKIDREFRDFDFLGLVTFSDPLRPGVRECIRNIAASGVKTIILTGDHEGTADAVARELGLIDGKGAVLTGNDLMFLKKEELAGRAGEVTVYARVTPEQKVLVTKLYRELGEIVAVTGDGVNDAPALEEADIGIAVGSGTDVAKSAADLVILDDNFETIVAAIEEGRRIVDNIRKVIVYLMSSVLDELLLIGGSLIVGVTLPLNALQILFVNFFSDSFPAIGFAFEKGIDGLGNRPRVLHKNLFDRQIRFLITVIGSITSIFLFMLYYLLLKAGFAEDLVRSFTFATFATYSLVLVFSLRSLEKSILKYNPFSNPYLTGGVLFGMFLTGLAIFLPFMQKILHTVHLPWPWFLGVLGVGILNICLVEAGKALFRKGILKF